MKKIPILLTLLFCGLLSAQNFSTGTIPFSNTAGLAYSAEIATDSENVTLTLVGPSDRWLGIGFGTQAMSGGDCVIFNGTTLSDRTFIGNQQPSVDAVQTWTLISNNVEGSTRTVVGTRSLNSGQPNNYVFNNTAEPISLIWARGGSSNFTISYHGGANRGITMSQFELITAPATPAPTPTHDAADVISIYGDTYTSIATNFDPFWGQSGHMQVNPSFSVSGGNTVLAYPNFNYQGTEVTTVNASAMEFLHVDIWTNADPNATTIQVSPINNGTGAGETLVTINHVAGQWYSVDIPKSAFTGMTWNSVFQMKFAANGPGSAVPVDIYLDNIYFWKEAVPLGAVATLSDLQVDGETIANFLAIDNDYTFEVPQGSLEIPQISATATDSNANIVITQATAVPGDATVVVTSQNSEVINTYTVAFSFALLTQPSMVPPTPTHDAADVISIYGDTYTSIATNYDPFWGQSGHMQVNPTFSIDEGNVVLAYPNFNYQGTELTTTNASAMEFLHVDIWTNADPNATIVQVSPINNGTGAGETLVTINHVAEQWYSVDIPKSAFTNMTWDSVFQLKFAANGPGSVVPITIYLDNIYFWKEAVPLGAVATLSDLQVDGETIANFLAIDNDYTFEVPQGSTVIPQITATATDSNATVVITQAAAVPGDATVVVTSQNGEVINTYTVAFSFELPTQPLTAAPDPTAMDVLSLFSNAYMNVPVSTWLTPWSAASLTDVQIMDNDTKVYSNLNFAGIEMTGDNSLDVTNAASFNLDFWTNNLTQLRIKLVDFGANNTFGGGDDTEHEITVDNPTQFEWVSLSISMDDFVNLTGRQHISQLIISGMPVGSGTVYVDNIYFEMAPMVMVPTTQVEGLCGQTLPTINSKVFFDNVIGATEYTYSVTNMMTNEEQVIVSTNRFFYFADLESFELGTVYAVKGKAQVGGNYGEYGAVCNVTTPLMPPTSQLRTAYCNTTLTTIGENIYANVVVGASMYKFKVANGMDEQEIERPRSRFSMAFATGITPGMTYDVSVAVMINGVWGEYGSVCTVTTPAALPTTQLRSSFCNGTVSSLGSNFYASVRVGASAYKFKTMINGEEVEVERTDSRCFMSAFPGAMMNQTYSIQVAVQFGGVWSEYGSACNLTVGTMAPKLQLLDGSQAFDIKAYPNPFVSQITLSLADETTQSDIMVYDMTGKLIQQIATEETSLEIGNDWSNGIYLVQIVQGQETKNIRIVKQ